MKIKQNNLPLALLLKNSFEYDGSLVDIYVENTSFQHWEIFVTYLSETYPEVIFSIDGSKTSLPVNVEKIFSDKENHSFTASFRISNAIVNAHFFSSDEIEMDFYPKDFSSLQEVEVLVEFCRRISNLLGLNVKFTPEGLKDVILLECFPEQL